MSTDAELLRRYADEKSEAAFAELVRLHLDLVYFAALRQVGGDPHRARDVAQSVFTDLARKAATLTERATLTGWLHTSTRFAATKLRRADSTRQHHEHEAATMNAFLSSSDSNSGHPHSVPDSAADWERLRPLIDETIHALDERDREAVLLRYFENRPFADIGAALRVSEDAARMRVDRALEKLRAALARRGVNSTGAALAVAFANQIAAASAPLGLASTITAAALAGATAAAGGLAAAGLSAGIFMSTKSTAIAAVVALAAIGATFLQWTHAQRAEVELAAVTAERDTLRSHLDAEQQHARRAAQESAALQSEIDTLKAKPAPAPIAPRPAPAPANALGLTPEEIAQVHRSSMSKAMMNNLHQFSAARDRFQAVNGHPPSSLDEMVGEGKLIRALVPVNGEDYNTLSLVAGQPLTLTDSDGVNITYDPSAPPAPPQPLTPAEQRVHDITAQLKPALGKAMEAYRAAHDGAMPTGPDALLPYFATPQEGADFAEILELQKASHK